MAHTALHTRLWHRIAAGAAAGAMMLSTVGASAQETHYTDVEAGVWYEEAASALLESGALDENESRLRPHDLATRAEVLKLLVQAYGEDLVYPPQASFSDVSRSAWYFPYVEAAARAGWIKGDRNCYETGTRSCTARPADGVNRAEMAALLQRAYRLDHLRLAPDFPDVSRGEWYYYPVQTAADHCILMGDGAGGRVRPASFMNRAEMVVMIHRTSMGMRYGDDCGQVDARIVSASAVSSDIVEVTFSVDLDANRMDDAGYYEIDHVGGASVDIDAVIVENARTVRLELEEDLDDDETYRVVVTDLRTDLGRTFDDVRSFVFRADEIEEEEVEVTIQSATALSATRLRLTFSEDVDETIAEERIRYRISGFDGDVSIDSVGLIDDNVVEIVLDESLMSQDLYTVTVTNLETSGGGTFTASLPFVYGTANVTFASTLNGASEVPAVSTSATGTGSFTLTSTGLQYDITLRNLSGSAITGAHFHRGDVGVSGPVVEPIVFNTATLRASGTWTDLTAEERSLLLDGDVYVNVHTTAYPNGEIRGQVTR